MNDAKGCCDDRNTNERSASGESLEGLIRFRVSPIAKQAFCITAAEFGLTSSQLLRKFVFAVLERPGLAERFVALHTSSHIGLPMTRPPRPHE